MKGRPVRRFRLVSSVAIASAALVAACSWDPSRPFDREAPQVNEALRAYDAGEAGTAAEVLEDYLATGGCSEGNIGTPLRLRERPNGSFDLGLALFALAEQYGQRFGEEENDAGQSDPNLKGLRSAHVDCALRVVRAVADDQGQAASLRARARYLEGNLLFLTAAYKEAVTAYEKALELVPGMGDAGPLRVNADAGAPWGPPDVVGRDAAWNRAVALRRIEDKKDAGPPPDAGGDSGKNEDSPDSGKNESPDAGDENKDAGSDDKNKDAGQNDDKNKDAGKDSGSDDSKQQKPPPKDEPKEDPKQPPPPSRQSQDDRILDQLENAPTVQQETVRQHGAGRKVRGMADK